MNLLIMRLALAGMIVSNIFMWLSGGRRGFWYIFASWVLFSVVWLMAAWSVYHD